MTDPVGYAFDNSIATITMDDGKVNALSIAMLEELHRAFDQAEQDGAVVVLGGREGFLSAGFDLKVFTGGSAEAVLKMLTLGATLCERILSFATPVVVASSGHAIAAGSFLVLSADARIGVEGPYQYGLNEVRIGLTVPWFAIEIARQRLGVADFDRAVISASMFSPQEAISAGFLDRVVVAEELHDVSLKTAVELSELNVAAHAATKLRARAGSLQALRAAIESELTPSGLQNAQGPA
jgi:enoyl-CoA hydratase